MRAPIAVAHTTYDRETEEKPLSDKEVLLRMVYGAALALVVVSIISLFVDDWLPRPSAIAVIGIWALTGIWRRYRRRPTDTRPRA